MLYSNRFRSVAAASLAIAATLFVGVPTASADPDPIAPGSGAEWTAESGLQPTGGLWDTTLPAGPSQGDPMQVVNGVFSVTQNMGQKALGVLGFGGAPTGATGVYGRQAVETAIARGGSQLGVPYSWGAGSFSGPTKGVDEDSNKVGFDCSGLTMYSYAGAGIRLPKYSGDQYNAGRKVPVAQAKRGDLLFYGPGGSQHVTIYLGNGQMLEANGSAGKVRVAPVRTGGMTPYAVRIVEW